MAGFTIVSLGDMIQTLGESKVKLILSKFSCPKNADVQYFLHSKAIEFEKQTMSKTHLVYASYKKNNVMVGYFSLSNKTIAVKKSSLSSKWRGRLRRFCPKNEGQDMFVLAVPLIGQVGKNFSNDYNQLITGKELLELACDAVRKAQSLLGGNLAYLECEEKEKLIEFYESNGFYIFNKRLLDKDEKSKHDGDYLVQLIKKLN